jgi:hypothetical protein
LPMIPMMPHMGCCPGRGYLLRARLAAAVRAFSLARNTALDAEARWRVRGNSDVRRPECKAV